MMTKPGRPRESRLDAAISHAMITLIIDRGFGQVTVEAVAKRAGTNKNAIYRRHKSLAHLTVSALSSQFGRDFDVETASLVEDLQFMVNRLARFFSDPLVAGSCADLLAAIQSNTDLSGPFIEGFLAPRLATVEAVLQRASERGEITAEPDPGWFVSLMVGPFLYRMLVPGAPEIDKKLTEEVTEALLDAVGAQSPARQQQQGDT